MKQNRIDKVSIKFKPGAYGVYRSLNNKPWYALAEYVDNALQSYIDNKELLLKLNPQYQLRISIDISKEDDLIRIYDNAGGINYDNFLRAFEPANIPIDNTGLSEFGMGMKIASIWFCDHYKVRSSYIGEKMERSVHFDLNKVIKEEKEELDVINNNTCNEKSHFTEVTLTKLSKNAPTNQGLQLQKIQDHIASIYRKFIRKGELILEFNGEPLKYNESEILDESWYNDPNSKKIYWKKEVHFEQDKYSFTGYIALLKEMSGINSGLSLFRRGRVIKGSHDEKYHPKILCGQPGSPRDKRLFGELELDGFNVSFEKGSFTELEELDNLLELVKLELQSDNLSILKQGDHYRKVKSSIEKRSLAEQVVKSIKKKEDSEEYKKTLRKTVNSITPSYLQKAENESNKIDQLKTDILDKIDHRINFNGIEYVINFEIIHDKGFENLYTLNTRSNNDGTTAVNSRINLEHSFFANHTIFENKESFEPIISIIKGLIISELFSQTQGTIMGGNLRMNLNKILKTL